MIQKKMNAGLAILNILIPFIFFVHQTSWLWLLAIIQCLILAYFYTTDSTFFVHSIFWPIFLVFLLILPWPSAFIVPLILYFGLLSSLKKTQNKITWLKPGQINRRTLWLMIPTILISSGALILWVVLLEPDLIDLFQQIPNSSLSGILIIGIIFSIFNSIWEEFILKGILWNGLEQIIKRPIQVNILQSALFGIMHWNGFPRGMVGAVLAAIYGLLLGFIRKESKGMLAPVITHFFADATIFGILIFLH